MAIELNRLVQKVEHKDISLVAGKEGISNRVNWVHMVESIEATKFLVGGEVVIVTGIGLRGEEGLEMKVRV